MKWIAAGRYSGHLSGPSLPHPSDVDVTGESAFNGLVATVCQGLLTNAMLAFFVKTLSCTSAMCGGRAALTSGISPPFFAHNGRPSIDYSSGKGLTSVHLKMNDRYVPGKLLTGVLRLLL